MFPTAFVGPLFSEHMVKTLRLLHKDQHWMALGPGRWLWSVSPEARRSTKGLTYFGA